MAKKKAKPKKRVRAKKAAKAEKPSGPPRILVTGFDPFGGERFNPSGWAVRRLEDDEIPRVELLRVMLPTSYRRAELGIRDLVRRFKPDGVVMFGLAPRRTQVSVEGIALNVDHAEEKDNTRQRRLRGVIDPRGPWVLETTLPVDRILAALRKAKIPSGLSYQPGTYVCNHACYVLLRSLQKSGGVPAGFVHLPPAKRLLNKGLKEEKLLQAVRVIVEQVAKTLLARRRKKRKRRPKPRRR